MNSKGKNRGGAIFECSHCGFKKNLPEKYVGRTLKCPNLECRQSVTIVAFTGGSPWFLFPLRGKKTLLLAMATVCLLVFVGLGYSMLTGRINSLFAVNIPSRIKSTGIYDWSRPVISHGCRKCWLCF